ncbi:hypothetical protein AYI74_02320 [Shewanella algae]|nr:hypothetical protein EEY24_13745 [Shewanella algae]OHY53686.1 hypothetical protein BEH76_07375 [Shewanella algae]PST65570.1 hypothetical protein AYI77_18220 [Shewanella algae]TVP06536.1 hypothetical protein AYI73_10540 [Shewanella algae]TWU70082.1 hypothetical protein AYI74_02320 [Shewanella algae]
MQSCLGKQIIPGQKISGGRSIKKRAIIVANLRRKILVKKPTTLYTRLNGAQKQLIAASTILHESA